MRRYRPEALSKTNVKERWEMPTFPTILHRLLHDMESPTETNTYIIAWDPDGKSFTIHQPKKFAEQIMRRYFREQTHYKSFQVRIYAVALHNFRKVVGMSRILTYLSALHVTFCIRQRQLHLYKFKGTKHGSCK